jgi:heat-inducible transcriptional repressor
MVRLTEYGYLKKTHISSGRVPTPAAMKFYVNQLMKEKELSVAEEVSVKEKLWDNRGKEHDFLKEAVRSLAEKTGAIAIAATDSGDYYISGYANILDMPEFYDIDLTKALLSAIDEFSCFKPLFEDAHDEDIHILLGEDLGPKLVGPYGFVFKKYLGPSNNGGEVGVIGPARLNYTYIVPAVRYYGNLIEEVARGW